MHEKIDTTPGAPVTDPHIRSLALSAYRTARRWNPGIAAIVAEVRVDHRLFRVLVRRPTAIGGSAADVGE